jgi:hypothetical protein
MLMRNWSRRQKRVFWALISLLVPAFIGLVGALGSWMNVPEFRRVTGLDPPPASPTPSPATAVAASLPKNPRPTKSATPTTPKKEVDAAANENAGRSPVAEEAAATVNPPPVTAPREERAESAAPGGTPFYIDSMEDTAFGIGAQLQGVWRARADAIEIEIPRPLLRLHTRAYHKGPRRLDAIKISIGTFDQVEPWKSTIKGESRLVRIGRLLSPGENTELEPLRFTIPKKGLSSLSNHQLIFQIENEAVDTGAHGNKTRSYAYSEVGIFRGGK